MAEQTTQYLQSSWGKLHVLDAQWRITNFSESVWGIKCSFLSLLFLHKKLPLHTVWESGGQVGRGSIVPSDSIQQSIPGGHAYSPSPFRHLCTECPLIRMRIKTFYWLETRTSIPTTNCIKSVERTNNK